jgi:hypothetical protein
MLWLVSRFQLSYLFLKDGAIKAYASLKKKRN